MKAISCGVIIIDKSTKKLLACHPSCHSYRDGNWDIPKGHVEENETIRFNSKALRSVVDDILNELGSVAEGVKTSKAVCELAKKYEIDVPLSEAIYEAVYTDITPQEIMAKLMNRKLKEEDFYKLKK